MEFCRFAAAAGAILTADFIGHENNNGGTDTMDVVIEEYQEADLREIMEVWNEVVAESNAFPQDKALTEEEARAFFGKQDVTAVAKWDGKVAGLYILHPNNVGRCGHQANASYAVSKKLRGRNVGEQLVSHPLPAGDFSADPHRVGDSLR